MPAKRLNISYYMKDFFIKEVMAKFLDLARISDMGERQFRQFERCIKDFMYTRLQETNDLMCSVTDFDTTETEDLLPKHEAEKAFGYK